MPLPILKDELSLRGSGPLVEPFAGYVSADNDPPRTLKALARIVDGELCHRCGSCIGICPTGVLGLDKDDFPTVKHLSACTDCELCVKVCPGDEFDVPAVSKQLFGRLPDVTDMHGHFREPYIGYAVDAQLRAQSTSGGLVSGILVALLEAGAIDGAVITVSDEKELWKGKPVVARTRREIVSAAKSKYAISPTNVTFSNIRELDGRYALVGLPCQIHGFLKAARLDRRLKERVIVTLGLFCHAAVEHDPMRFIFNQLGPYKHRAVRFISRVGKHPGTPHIELEDGSLYPVYFPKARGYRPSSMEILNLVYRLYTPARCLTCYDSTAEFADIAVGDPWMAPPSDSVDFREGYSFALARTLRGEEIIRQAEEAGEISLIRLRHDHARTSNRMMGEEKRWRAFRIIETRKRRGQSAPDYAFPIPKASGKHFILTELNMLSHWFCFARCGREKLMSVIFSRFGYVMLWLNYQRRTFRTWRRDTRARIRRRRAEKLQKS